MSANKQNNIRIETVCAAVVCIVCTSIFQANASHWFPAPAGGGLNFERVLWAGLVGGASAAVGYAIGMLIQSLKGK